MSILSLLVSLYAVNLAYQYDIKAQDRQLKLEKIAKLEGASANLIASAGTFIVAINNNENLSAARQQLNQVVAGQINLAEGFGTFGNGNVAKKVVEYQEALQELNQVAEKTSSVTEMRPWSESFGRVVDTGASLINDLYATLGS